MSEIYGVICRKCGFQVFIALEAPPTEETTTVCEACIALETF